MQTKKAIFVLSIFIGLLIIISSCNLFSKGAPDAPLVLTAEAESAHDIELKWTDASNNEVGFGIERKKDGEDSFHEIAKVSMDTETYTDSNLISNTTYSYRVYAYNNSGNSGYSRTASTTTSQEDDIPDTPSNLIINEIIGTEISLSWHDNSDNEDGFKIERKQGEQGLYTELQEIAEINAVSFIDTGLIPNTLYYYRIRAFNSEGNSGYSNEISGMTKGIGIPENPIPSDESIVSEQMPAFDWNDVQDALGYEIQVSETNTFSSTIINDNSLTSSGYQATIALDNNTTYYWRVRIRNNSSVWADWNNSHIWSFETDFAAFNINITISDKDTNDPVLNTNLYIIETDHSQVITSNSEIINLNRGIYNIYFTHADYRAKGYVIDLDRNYSINVKLKHLEEITYDTKTISGQIQENGTPYTDYFSLCAGIEGLAKIREDIIDPTGSFSDIESYCGTVTISAFTKDISLKVDKIVYEKNRTLNEIHPLDDLVLNFTSDALLFSGTKPVDGDLKIKLNNSFFIAMQGILPGNNEYEFNIDLNTGDTVNLESIRYDGLNTYYTKATGSSSNRIHNLVFENILPVLDVSEDSEYYILSFTEVTGTVFYTSFILEITGDTPNIPIDIVNTTSNGIIQIPKTIINSTANQLIVYVNAVFYPDFDLIQLLQDTLTYTEYSYSETGSDITGTLAKSTQRNRMLATQSVENYREKYGIFYLTIE